MRTKMRMIFFKIMQCHIQKLINFLYRNNIGSESDKNDDNYDESDSNYDEDEDIDDEETITESSGDDGSENSCLDACFFFLKKKNSFTCKIIIKFFLKKCTA